MNFIVQRPEWRTTIVALLGLALTLSASYWQFGRASDKAALRQQYSARQAMLPHDLGNGVPSLEDAAFRKMRATGMFVPEKAILLDNKLRAGAAGYEIVVPLQLSGSDRHVLINRGWVQRGRDRSDLPVIDVPENAVTIVGTAIVPGRGALELSDEIIEGRVWQNLNLSRYRERQQLNILDFVIQEESDHEDGINRNWPAPGFGIRTHQSYAVQWLLFATLIIFFYCYYGLFRKKTSSTE
ncbi:MAG TPA: SURF1 family protein [Burkholderiales bacterium]|nr:SURF1 family protein [Burkholderiales bacterium]